MNSGLFASAIGRQADSEDVRDLLDRMDFDGRINIRGSETDTYVSNKEKGISLLFESERSLHAEHGVSFPSDAPVLTAIFLYGPGDGEFSVYKGDLPAGLTFNDGREEVLKKLGPSRRFNPDRRSESWDFSDRVRFFVRYVAGNNSIARLQYGVLWK